MIKRVRLTSGTLVVARCLAVTCLAACGSTQSASSAAPQPTATMVATDTPPTFDTASRTGSSLPAGTAMATGKHDRVGAFCSGRDQPRFASEGMICIVGRLEKKSAAASAKAAPAKAFKTGEACSLTRELAYVAAGLRCVKGHLLAR